MLAVHRNPIYLRYFVAAQRPRQAKVKQGGAEDQQDENAETGQKIDVTVEMGEPQGYPTTGAH
jgi:hypothetical protein